VPDKKSVLVVEDNPQNLELVAFLLEEAGLEVRSATDADEARAELERLVPDLVLMDMQLPGTDGLTLVVEIRQSQRYERLLIVALTAHALRGDRERFIEGGCDGYISKPIEVGTFVAEVERLLESGRPGPGSSGDR